VNEAKASFGKKVDTYNSEVLWKIQTCEEALKDCAREKRVYDLNRMHMNEVSINIKAIEKAMKESVKEVNDRFTLRIKQAETYTTDKFTEASNYLRDVESKFDSKASLSEITRLDTARHELKVKFDTEFEAIQTYLRDQSIKFTQMVTRFREIETKISTEK
jgi:uncharacterized protein YajQ (UPF0234 family)